MERIFLDSQSLADLIANPPINMRLVILEAYFQGECEYQHQAASRHIPGAISVHPSYFESGRDTSRYYPQYRCPDDGNLLNDDALRSAAAELGISADTVVAVYGKGAVEMMSALRVFWSLKYLAVRDVFMLNGGFQAWRGPWSTVPATPNKIAEFGGVCDRRYLATTDEIESGMRDIQLIDIRSFGEYCGRKSDVYPFFTASGHIAGALWGGNWTQYVDADSGKLKALDKIKQLWKSLGIVPDPQKTMVFYCGTGWRSCLGFACALLMGYRAKNYDDSFYGWVTRGNPVRKLLPSKM